MSTAVDFDIDLEIGLMEWAQEAPPCEHHQHGVLPSHTDAPATHYGRGHCRTCEALGPVAALCEGYVNVVRSGTIMQCPYCKSRVPAFELVDILGPIK